MPIVPLTIADMKPLLAIDAADTSADTNLTALLSAQQPALEYGLDPAILAASAGNAGLSATPGIGPGGSDGGRISAASGAGAGGNG